MNIDKKIDRDGKKATITFTCELDLTNTLKTEVIEQDIWEVRVDGAVRHTFGDEKSADEKAAEVDGTVSHTPAGERCVLDEDAIAADIHAKALAAFQECHTACDPKCDPDKEYAEAIAKIEAEREKKVKLRSAITAG